MLDQLISAVLQNVLQKDEARSAAADFFGMLATPAKRAAAMTGYLPEGYRWQTPTEASKWMEDAALGFVGSVTPKVGIRAYHGSPYDFDKFSMSKIGTGEGAQSYGHGLYFAENPAVAQTYKITPNQKTMGPASTWVAKAQGDWKKALELFDEFAGAGNLTPAQQQVRADLVRGNTPGRMYEVNIRANPNEFLDWDKPLYNQIPKPILDAETRNFYGKSAEEINSSALKFIAQKVIESPTGTKELVNHGIPGIRYLDQGSRAAGDGSRNYVLFRDDIIDILRKFLVPLTIGGGVLAEGTYSSPAKAAQ